MLCKRKKEQNSLVNEIKQDADLQYAAVLMLIEKSDYRNIELHNQIALVQYQLSKLTTLELRNRRMQINEHIVSNYWSTLNTCIIDLRRNELFYFGNIIIILQNELSERRLLLSDLLQDIFAQQQRYRQQLIQQLRDVESRRTSEVRRSQVKLEADLTEAPVFYGVCFLFRIKTSIGWCNMENFWKKVVIVCPKI